MKEGEGGGQLRSRKKGIEGEKYRKPVGKGYMQGEGRVGGNRKQKGKNSENQ